MWNLFDIYIFILRRVNFTVEYVAKDKFYKEHKLKLINSKLEAEKENLEHPTTYDKVREGKEITNDLYCFQCYGNLLSNAKKNSRSSYRCFSPNRTVGFDRNLDYSKNLDVIDNKHICKYYLNSNESERKKRNLNSNIKLNVKKRADSIASYLSSIQSHITSSRLSIRFNNLEYSYLHLGLFMLNLTISSILTAKLILYSTFWTYNKQINAANYSTGLIYMSKGSLLSVGKDDDVEFSSKNLTNLNDVEFKISASRSNFFYLFNETRDAICFIIKQAIINDSFKNFNNSKTINMIATTLILPSTCTRLVCLIRLIHNIFLAKDIVSNNDKEENFNFRTRDTNKMRDFYGSISSLNSHSYEDKDNSNHHNDFSSNYDKISSNSHNNNKIKSNSQTINVVQLNMAYMSALQTTTSNWWRLAKESWLHKHSISNFRREKKIVENISLIEGTEPSRIDLKTRMYFYNLIQFNDCYKDYFGIKNPDAVTEDDAEDKISSDEYVHSENHHNKQNSYDNETRENNVTSDEQHSSKSSTIIRRIHNNKINNTELIDMSKTITQANKSLGVSNDNSMLKQLSFESNENSTRLSYDFNKKFFSNSNNHEKLKRGNVFISKPLHRLDLNEMGWMILMVIILYFLSLLSIVLPSFSALMIEMKISTFEELFTYETIRDRLIGVILSLGILRFLHVLLWQIIILFSIFDLFNFFSCCLICFSRARYLRLHLEQVHTLCGLIRHIREENNGISMSGLNMLDGSLTSYLAETDLKKPLTQYKSTTSNEGNKPSIEQNKTFSYKTTPLSVSPSSKTFITMGNTTSGHTLPTNWSDLEFHTQEEVAFYNIRSKIHFDKIEMAHRNKELVSQDEYIDSINKRIEFIIDLDVLIQKELADVKKFFTTYLNLEIIFKVLCMAFSVTALLEHKNIFEFIFLIFNTNTGATPIIIVLIMAAFIEIEFRAICKTMTRIMVNGRQIITLKNIKRLIKQADYLSNKSNRSFEVIGNFSLTLGSLAPVIGWIATGVVLLRR